jgi:hypothetical protein
MVQHSAAPKPKGNTMTQVNSTTHPELYKAMDAAAKAYWAYPNLEWQQEFIDSWLESHPEQA